MAISGRTRVAAVLGDPVEHSLSPVMHNRAFRRLDLDWVYVALRVRAEHLGAALGGVRGLGLAGVNLTIPHKTAALAYLDEVDPTARLVGAVNTVVVREGRLVGYNTDGAGFTRSLREEAGVDPAGRRAVLLGAGGAARSIAFQLGLEGASELVIANRTEARAQSLAADLHRTLDTPPRLAALGLRDPQLARALAEADLLIQGTASGMHPRAADPPPVPPRWLHPGLVVCDIVYRPARTELLKAAARRGCRVLPGLGMLVHQGALALELWTGLRAPVEEMRRALEEALGTPAGAGGI